MPTLTDITLNLQHGGGSTQSTSPRTATVTFTTNFNAIEVLARAIFKADVKIVSVETGNTFAESRSVGTAYVQATNNTVQKTVTSNFERRNLDEDIDLGPRGPLEQGDEWVARVTLSPVVYDTVTSNSPMVTGSWGALGED